MQKENIYYLIVKNAANIGFSGLNWNTSKYLYPISNKQFRLTTAVRVLTNMKVLPFIRIPDGAEMMELYLKVNKFSKQ